MPKIKYIPNADLYNQYYVGRGDNQIYRGSIIQRGYGIGGLISSLFRSGLPLLKNIVMPMLKRSAVSTLKNVGKKVAENVLRSGTNSVINAITKTNTKKRKKKLLKLNYSRYRE